ncbi:replication initiation protein [Enterococcus pseudoavium]|nr:replication initiation protein [Enterococcus pseudoavium]
MAAPVIDGAKNSPSTQLKSHGESVNSGTPSPTSNTGDIGGTRGTGDYRLLIDYVLVSFVGTSSAAGICHYLFAYLADFEVSETSYMRGFGRVLSNGKIHFHYENKDARDVTLMEIRGGGCRFLEEQDAHSWHSFFEQVTKVGEVIELDHFAFKRIDIAIDVFKSNNALTPVRALNYLKKNLITSRFHTSRTIHEYRIKNGKLSGESFYFGKRSSDLSILIYDKRLESRSEENIWYRTELRMRNSWGMKTITTILNPQVSFSKFVAETLKSNIQFRSSVHKRSELRRRPLAVWYLNYLSYVERQGLHGLNKPEVEAGDPNVDSRK